MRQCTLVAALLCGLFGATADAEVTVSMAPYTRVGFGDTRYEIAIIGLDTDTTVWRGGSRLIFPLDVVQSGLQFGLNVMKNGHRAWTVDAQLGASVGNPHSQMSDDDWRDVGPVELLWSHTLSDVEGSVWTGGFQVSRLLTARRNFELGILAGLEYQKIKQRMVSLSGWQYRDYNSGVDTDAYVVDDHELALTYEIRYVRSQVGLVTRWLSGGFSSELKATIAPLVYVKDIDDHVRRGFQIRTDGRGIGVGGSLLLRYVIPSESGARPFASLGGDFFGTELDTEGIRNYYMSDSRFGIAAGDQFSELHRVRTRQYGICLAAGLEF